jgi:hypothetical protein
MATACAAAAGAAAAEPVAAKADETSTEGYDVSDVEPRPAANAGSPRRAGVVRDGAKPIAPLDPPASWDYEVDAVVVGTGLGGLSGALYLAQNGLTVIALEKEALTGGAGRHACVNICCMGGTKAQNEIGYAWPNDTFDPDDPEQVKDVAAEFMAHYQYSVDPDLMCRQISDGPKWYDWLDEVEGIDLEPRDDRRFFLRDVNVRLEGHNAVLGNNGICNALTDAIEAAGGQIKLKCACTGLVMDEGRVVGVAFDEDGEEHFAKAERGVILAAGGMGMNLDMLEEYIPSAYLFATSGGPLPSHTGEVIRMGVGAGADIAGWNSFDCWDGALDEYWGPDGDGEYWHYMWKTTGIIGESPFMSIDKRGNRLPYYVGSGTRQPQERFEGGPFGGGGEAIVTQFMAAPGHRKYLIWDSAFNMETFEQWNGTGYEYLAPKTYVWGALSDAAKSYVPETWDIEYQAAIDRGTIKVADTIEELGALWGFEPGVMETAVERWNACCEAGEDTDCIVPYDPSWMLPITEPPFYCGCYGAQIGKTNCGLRVTDKMQVVDTNARVIPGLYAAWSTAGGLVGENMFLNYGNTSPLGCSGLSGATGWFAARSMLGEFDA